MKAEAVRPASQDKIAHAAQPAIGRAPRPARLAVGRAPRGPPRQLVDATRRGGGQARRRRRHGRDRRRGGHQQDRRLPALRRPHRAARRRLHPGGRAAAAPAARGDGEQRRTRARWSPPAIETYLAFLEADPELYRFVVARRPTSAADPAGADPIGSLSDLVGEQAAAAVAVALAAGRARPGRRRAVGPRRRRHGPRRRRLVALRGPPHDPRANWPPT